MRNRLSPAFTTSKLKAMFSLVNHCAESFSNFLVKSSEPVEFKGAFTRLTNDVIATVAFGYDSKAITNPDEEFYKLALDMTQFKGVKRTIIVFGYMLVPRLMEFLRIPFLPEAGTTFFKSLIDSAMEYRTKSGKVN